MKTDAHPPVVVVTGATGFIGRHLVPDLVRAGGRVRACARESAGRRVRDVAAAFAHATTLSADELDAVTWVPQPALAELDHPGALADWRRVLDGCDGLVHLAGIAHADRAIEEAVYARVNGSALVTIATAAREAAARTVFISSVRAQSGPVAHGVLTEDHTPAPTDAYGRSKLRGERVLFDIDPNAIVLRPVLVYGRGVKGNMATLARLARLPVPLPLAGLTARRSILSVAALCDAIRFALGVAGPAAGGDRVQERNAQTFRPAPPLTSAARAHLNGRVFLVADPDPLTVPDMITAMRRGLNRAPALWPLPVGLARLGAAALGKQAAWDRVNGDLMVSTERLRAAGWVAQQSAAEGLSEMMFPAGG